MIRYFIPRKHVINDSMKLKVNLSESLDLLKKES